MCRSEGSLIDWNRNRTTGEIFNRLPVPLLLLDDMGRICWHNEAWTNEVTIHDFLPDDVPANPSLRSSHGSPLIHLDSRELVHTALMFLRGPDLQAEVTLACLDDTGHNVIGARLFRIAQPAAALIAIVHGAAGARLDGGPVIESVVPWLSVDREGRITSCSAVLLKRLDLSSGSIQGIPAWELVHADDRDFCQQMVRNHCDSSHPRGGQMRLMRRDGEFIVFELHVIPMRNAAGETVGLRIALFDITERERAQEALAESLDLYRTLAECCGAGVWHISHHGHTLYANPAMCELLEISSPAELTENALDEFFPPASRERIRTEEQKRQQGQVSHYEVEMIGRRGTRRQVQVTGATLPDGDYRFSGFLGIFIDVTASQKRESEVRQTQKMEAVGRLAAGIAHEINTPIQFAGDSIQFLRDALKEVEMLIARYREALASDPSTLAEQRQQLRLLEQDMDLEYLQEQMPKAIERSLEGLNRVAAIVRAMKAFAHPDDGRKGHVDLNQALLNTLTIARNEYKYVADIVTDLGELPLVVCNLSELNQVFLNLLVNAAHAIGEKTRQQPNFRGVIHVTTRVDGDHIAVTISDTGIGIPAAIRHKIFDPFFTTKPVGKGTGQGLTIAHTVVERHGGTISFTTDEEEGASFTIRLPIHGV